MRAPQTDVLLDSGESVPLASLYAEEPLALVFLRHLGCIFCKYHVAQLRPLADANVVFVAMAGPEEARAFAEKMRSPHRFICDPDRKLYELFDLKRATVAQIMSIKVFTRSVAAMRAGHRQSVRPTADPKQLAGSFIIGVNGIVVWEHRAEDPSDNAYADDIRRELAPLVKQKAGV